MAFRQHRPQPARQLSFHIPESATEAGPATSPQRKRTLEESEEWVLFSPAPHSATRTHSYSTERTSGTAGLSHLSEFGSLNTAAPSYQIDDDITCQGTVTEEAEELDSLDDGLHAFHEPSEYGAPPGQLQESAMTVLPTHDGLGTFQPNPEVQEHILQFERQNGRRRPVIVRRRSSVQRRLDALEEAEELNHEQERRLRIEKWRMEQSKALLEEIEKETRRRRRMSLASGKSRGESQRQETKSTSAPRTVASVSSEQSAELDDSTENLSFWQRLTRRVIRDLMGIDEDTLSVIFGESLPEDASSVTPISTDPVTTVQKSLLLEDHPTYPGEPWETRLLERIARELGILVHQLSEHPGAFSTYLKVREAPEYVGIPLLEVKSRHPVSSETSAYTQRPRSSSASNNSPIDPIFASINYQQSALHSDASLWGIEEEPDQDPLEAFRARHASSAVAVTEEAAREREYWEQELDVKMVFNFLMKRFSSRHQSGMDTPRPAVSRTNSAESVSARRAAIIRQNHPLVNRNTSYMPTSSSTRDTRRKDLLHRHHNHHFNHAAPLRSQALRSSSSCGSQSTKKSKRSSNSKNYWDFGGSVGSGSVLAAEV